MRRYSYHTQQIIKFNIWYFKCHSLVYSKQIIKQNNVIRSVIIKIKIKIRISPGILHFTVTGGEVLVGAVEPSVLYYYYYEMGNLWMSSIDWMCKGNRFIRLLQFLPSRQKIRSSWQGTIKRYWRRKNPSLELFQVFCYISIYF